MKNVGTALRLIYVFLIYVFGIFAIDSLNWPGFIHILWAVVFWCGYIGISLSTQ